MWRNGDGGQYVVSGGLDGLVSMWRNGDASSEEQPTIHNFMASSSLSSTQGDSGCGQMFNPPLVHDIAFVDANRSHVLCALADGSLRTLKISSGKRRSRKHKGAVAPRKLVWDELSREGEHHTAGISVVERASFGKENVMITGGSEGNIVVWDVDKEKHSIHAAVTVKGRTPIQCVIAGSPDDSIRRFYVGDTSHSLGVYVMK
jgi:WD40 repeat protein